VHLAGFIIRIYHDARSPERQILFISARNTLIPWSSSRQPHHITKYSIRNPEKYVITAERKVTGCEHTCCT